MCVAAKQGVPRTPNYLKLDALRDWSPMACGPAGVSEGHWSIATMVACPEHCQMETEHMIHRGTAVYGSSA